MLMVLFVSAYWPAANANPSSSLDRLTAIAQNNPQLMAQLINLAQTDPEAFAQLLEIYDVTVSD